MSNKSFIDHFFCWVANFKYDYRKEICPWCKHDPKHLACDGTHIGVSIKHLNLDPAVTKPDLEDHLPSVHKRLNRCLLPLPQADGLTPAELKYRCDSVKQAKDYLRDLCYRTVKGESAVCSQLQGLTPEEQVAERARIEEKERDEREKLFQVIGWMGRPGLLDFMTMFCERSCHHSITKAAGKLLQLLMTHDIAVSTVIPFRYHTQFRECCDAVQASSAESNTLLDSMRSYSVEVSDLLLACQTHNRSAVAVKFIRELVDFTEMVHAGDRPTAVPVKQDYTYNPPSGAAYYFTDHGCQVRSLPTYNVSGEEKKQNDACQKHFPQVSLRGFGYMFLFFDPLHGHCYGFHLIDGGEGRKDPFSAILRFKPSPPEELFYDFACQMAEYSLNREPDFWKWVRFWHDLFHGVNHLCIPCFKSSRVESMECFNSEICEQFNAYLKAIQFTGSHLSQKHFMLFTQWMILRWNRKKTQICESIARVAFEGLD